jgi:hypothetical protein
MKLHLIVLAMFATAAVFGQKTKPFTLFDLTLDLPENVSGSEDGSMAYTASTDNTLIMLLCIDGKEALQNTQVTDQGTLELLYQQTQRELLGEVEILSDTFIKRDGLKWASTKFLLEADGEQETRFCDMLFLNEKMYIIYLCEIGTNAAKMEAEREALRASVKLPEELSSLDQYVFNKSSLPQTIKVENHSNSRSWRWAIRLGVLAITLLVGLGIRASRNN